MLLPTTQTANLSGIPPLIKPTIGRRVWYFPSSADRDIGHADPLVQYDWGQPLDAGVCYVWGDRLVNLSIADQCGRMHSRTSVRLLQEDDKAGDDEACATWMPYQQKNAAPTP